MQVDNVLVQLRNTDPISFQKFFRMDIAKFEEVLALISTLIERRDTNYREAIPAGERLAVTLRFLATGQDTDAAVARSSASRTTVSCSGVHCIAYTISVSRLSGDGDIVGSRIFVKNNAINNKQHNKIIRFILNYIEINEQLRMNGWTN